MTSHATRTSFRWPQITAEWFVGAALVASCILTQEWLDAAPVLCATKRLFGLPCPGCGMTHAWVATAHGDFATAFAANAFGPPLFAVAALWLGLRMSSRGRAWLDTAAQSARWPLRIAIGAWFGWAIVRVGTQLLG